MTHLERSDLASKHREFVLRILKDFIEIEYGSTGPDSDFMYRAEV